MPGSRLDQPHDLRCADDDAPAPPPQRPDRPASAAQTQRLVVLFRQAGYDRAGRLAAAGEVVDHPVTSCSKLTERENRAVCDWLQRSYR